MSFIDVSFRPARVWIADRHVHHGAIGILQILVGAALVVHDRKDAPWLPTRDDPAEARITYYRTRQRRGTDGPESAHHRCDREH